MKVHKFDFNGTKQENCGIKFGGGAFLQGEWPKNPAGKDLSLLFTIDTDKLNSKVSDLNLPSNKFISVFSTYDENDYFLDDVSFSGDPLELEDIEGYTKVTISDQSSIQNNSNAFDSKDVNLVETEISDDDFPAFSLISDQIPNGLSGSEIFNDEYRFICQVYSMDLPPYDGSALYLSDAIGYLFLKKNIVDNNDAGFFFVQSA
ncbi:DUF1963 domain-containing protein [Xylocopilactobacillus apicola]|uniref:DUF1963 domain-containing protein n=1 Tax=Xylocopilactobacillus apicola TaxID=2932184 RepID=A0AAU9DL73_9LACO|nr:DUF1963 domain-containing protein [Xylocopilactobacillus apicola]BDR57627.1 hypothetical protein XA3_00680 [Xylocopilactobacillus apicola]